MMKFLKELFKKESELYSIEKNSVLINKEVFSLIVKTEKILDELKNYLDSGKVSFKDAKLAEFENSLINMKSKIDSLRLDVQRILEIELKNKDYILLNDDFYLKDKFSRIDTMSQIIDELLDLINERPAVSELKEMTSYLYSKMNSLADSVNNIITDDKYLEDVYSRLRNLWCFYLWFVLRRVLFCVRNQLFFLLRFFLVIMFLLILVLCFFRLWNC